MAVRWMGTGKENGVGGTIRRLAPVGERAAPLTDARAGSGLSMWQGGAEVEQALSGCPWEEPGDI